MRLRPHRRDAAQKAEGGGAPFVELESDNKRAAAVRELGYL